MRFKKAGDFGGEPFEFTNENELLRYIKHLLVDKHKVTKIRTEYFGTDIYTGKTIYTLWCICEDEEFEFPTGYIDEEIK